MGDFVGGMLKYLRRHPVPRVTIAGGFGKMTKLAQGLLDLHSQRGAVDLALLAELAEQAGGSAALARRILAANTAAEAFAHAEKTASRSAMRWRVPAGRQRLRLWPANRSRSRSSCSTATDRLVGHAPFVAAHAAPPLKRRR